MISTPHPHTRNVDFVLKNSILQTQTTITLIILLLLLLYSDWKISFKATEDIEQLKTTPELMTELTFV